jgi:cysteine desulfurase
MIYLDAHSTTQTDPRIITEMAKCYSEIYGNPSSSHEMGLEALSVVETARKSVAELLGANSIGQIYFTSSATEANNIILKGKWQYHRARTKKELNIIITPIEHKSILNTALTIQRLDHKTHIHYLRINKDGTLDLDDLRKKLRLKNILLVSVMTANNEIGTIQDIKTISKMCAEQGVFFHTDMVQALGKIKVDLENVDALTCNAHKTYGPRGVGVLYLEENEKIDPIIDGGLQNTFTSGTINTPAIAGMGMVCSILKFEQNTKDLQYIKKLRDLLLGGIMAGLDNVYINGSVENRLVNNINISIKDVPAEVFLNLPDICLSSGAACISGSHEPSYVLKEIGAKYSDCALRFGLSKFNTEKEILYTIERIIEIARAVRNG